MAGSMIDIYTVEGNQMFGEMVNKEYGLAEAWWTGFRDRTEKKLALAIGAVPEKEPFVGPVMEQIPLGKAAAKPVTIEDKYTSTTNASNYLVQSSPMHDYFKESGYWKEMAKYRKKGLPSHYGRSLHSSSADGTDYSSRRG